ncbi:helix-turn-helix domain-containing protein [Streptomyces indicus]|uniref:helix-turn-helix domain-containing protein n=1 Tax=Streptomyces indicus TaxID=417292 RepID=UPI0015A2F71A|nr:helix-turn-helix transcriptional regulator [Streptomyces indicus]
MDDLAELIERVMREKDWTLSTLARRSGISTSTLHSWKSGDRATGSRGPSPALLRKFADGAGLTVAEVFEAAGRHVPAAMDDETERRFLHMLRALSDDDRKVVEATMQAMAERQRS